MTRQIDRWGFPLRSAGFSEPAPAEISTTPQQPQSRRQAGYGSFSPQLLPRLRELCAATPEGTKLTRHAIGEACGVSKDTIRLIERAAIRKIRARLGIAHRRQLAEVLRFNFTE